MPAVRRPTLQSLRWDKTGRRFPCRPWRTGAWERATGSKYPVRDAACWENSVEETHREDERQIRGPDSRPHAPSVAGELFSAKLRSLQRAGIHPLRWQPRAGQAAGAVNDRCQIGADETYRTQRDAPEEIVPGRRRRDHDQKREPGIFTPQQPPFGGNAQSRSPAPASVRARWLSTARPRLRAGRSHIYI